MCVITPDATGLTVANISWFTISLPKAFRGDRTARSHSQHSQRHRASDTTSSANVSQSSLCWSRSEGGDGARDHADVPGASTPPPFKGPKRASQSLRLPLNKRTKKVQNLISLTQLHAKRRAQSRSAGLAEYSACLLRCPRRRLKPTRVVCEGGGLGLRGHRGLSDN